MLAPTPTPDASQWNIGGIGSSGVGHVYFMYIACILHVYFMYIACILHVYCMYIACILHVVCASFSALATRKLADAKAVFSGIWALQFVLGRCTSIDQDMLVLFRMNQLMCTSEQSRQRSHELTCSPIENELFSKCEKRH